MGEVARTRPLNTQNQAAKLWEIRNSLKEELHKNNWKELLQQNNQELPNGGDNKV